MKNRSLIFGFVALACAAFVFFGCPTEADDNGGDDFTPLEGLSLKNGGSFTAGDDTSGLRIASAKKSNSTGEVTIVLTGAVGTAYQAVAAVPAGGGTTTVTLGADSTFQANFVPDFTPFAQGASAANGAAAGVYAPVYIDGLITADAIAAGTLAGRQTNEALRFYTGIIDELLPDSPTAPVVNGTNIWVPSGSQTGAPTKWKAYVDENNVPNFTLEPSGFLIWNGGTGTAYPDRKITYELSKITIAGGSATVDNLLTRYIIDYSEVTFSTPASEASELANALGNGATASGATVTVTGTTVSIAEGKTITVDDGVTLSVASGATLSVASGAALSVASGATLSVTGTLSVDGTLSVEGTVSITGNGEIIEDVSSLYALADSQGTATTSVRGTSANLDATASKVTKSDLKPTVIVTLTPKANPGTPLSWFTTLQQGGQGYDLWGPNGSSAPNDWKWTDFRFDVGSLLIGPNTSNVVSFKVESFSYYYYAGNEGNASAAPTYPRANDLGSIYIPATYSIDTIPVRWKANNKATFNNDKKNLSIILGSGGSKIITLRVYSHASTYSDATAVETAQDTGTHFSTIVIDYTALTAPSGS
jgi:hypothetical protein